MVLRSHKIEGMKQGTLKLNLSVKKTRKQLFLEEMEQIAP